MSTGTWLNPNLGFANTFNSQYSPGDFGISNYQYNPSEAYGGYGSYGSYGSYGGCGGYSGFDYDSTPFINSLFMDLSDTFRSGMFFNQGFGTLGMNPSMYQYPVLQQYANNGQCFNNGLMPKQVPMGFSGTNSQIPPTVESEAMNVATTEDGKIIQNPDGTPAKVFKENSIYEFNNAIKNNITYGKNNVETLKKNQDFYEDKVSIKGNEVNIKTGQESSVSMEVSPEFKETVDNFIKNLKGLKSFWVRKGLENQNILMVFAAACNGFIDMNSFTPADIKLCLQTNFSDLNPGKALQPHEILYLMKKLDEEFYGFIDDMCDHRWWRPLGSVTRDNYNSARDSICELALINPGKLVAENNKGKKTLDRFQECQRAQQAKQQANTDKNEENQTEKIEVEPAKKYLR